MEPMRLTRINKLSDNNGNFMVFMKCRTCGHFDYLAMWQLLRRFDPDTSLDIVAKHTPCSRCIGQGRTGRDVEAVPVSRP